MLQENEKEAFKKHNIKFLPTMLLLTPDEREIGRFMDFHAPRQFVEKLKECAQADENLEKARELLAKDPENDRGLYLRAMGNLYKADRLTAACADLEKLARKECTDANKAHVFQAMWLLADTARKRFDKRTWISERNKYLRKLIESDLKNESGHLIEAVYMLATYAMVKKDTGLMEKYFARIKDLDPQDKSGYADDMAFARAYAPYYSKDYKGAAVNLDKFLLKHGKSGRAPEACSKLAVCWYRAKEKEKTIKTLEKLLKDYPYAKEAAPAGKWLKRLKNQ